MTRTPDHHARALIDQAAAALGWTTAGPRRACKDDPEPGPMPATATDPATGRAYAIAENVTGDTVRLTLAGLSAAQAVRALAAIADA